MTHTSFQDTVFEKRCKDTLFELLLDPECIEIHGFLKRIVKTFHIEMAGLLVPTRAGIWAVQECTPEKNRMYMENLFENHAIQEELLSLDYADLNKNKYIQHRNENLFIDLDFIKIPPLYIQQWVNASSYIFLINSAYIISPHEGPNQYYLNHFSYMVDLWTWKLAYYNFLLSIYYQKVRQQNRDDDSENLISLDISSHFPERAILEKARYILASFTKIEDLYLKDKAYLQSRDNVTEMLTFLMKLEESHAKRSREKDQYPKIMKNLDTLKTLIHDQLIHMGGN